MKLQTVVTRIQLLYLFIAEKVKLFTEQSFLIKFISSCKPEEKISTNNRRGTPDWMLSITLCKLHTHHIEIRLNMEPEKWINFEQNLRSHSIAS